MFTMNAQMNRSLTQTAPVKSLVIVRILLSRLISLPILSILIILDILQFRRSRMTAGTYAR
jgi:hypothetical protein